MIDFKQIKKLLKQDNSDLPEIRIALLGDTATQFLATAIRGIGVERGYNISLFESEYNQIDRQLLDPSSDYHEFQPEYTIILQSTHKLLEQYSLRNSAEWSSLADDRLSDINNYISNTVGKLIYCNYSEIDDTVFGLVVIGAESASSIAWTLCPSTTCTLSLNECIFSRKSPNETTSSIKPSACKWL